jgi:hypothetical protein
MLCFQLQKSENTFYHIGIALVPMVCSVCNALKHYDEAAVLSVSWQGDVVKLKGFCSCFHQTKCNTFCYCLPCGEIFLKLAKYFPETLSVESDYFMMLASQWMWICLALFTSARQLLKFSCSGKRQRWSQTFQCFP